MIETPWHFRPFEHRDLDTTAYRFVMPSVAISGDDLPLDYDLERHQYHVIQDESRDGEPGPRWEVWADSHPTVVLALIAARCGYTATFEPIPE